MAELALINTLIHLRVQKAMCVNDCRNTFKTCTHTNNVNALLRTPTQTRH